MGYRLIPKSRISANSYRTLSGLLSHIGLKEAEKQQYLGARNAHLAIFPILCFSKTTEMGDGGRVGNLQTLGGRWQKSSKWIELTDISLKILFRTALVEIPWRCDCR